MADIVLNIDDAGFDFGRANCSSSVYLDAAEGRGEIGVGNAKSRTRVLVGQQKLSGRYTCGQMFLRWSLSTIPETLLLTGLTFDIGFCSYVDYDVPLYFSTDWAIEVRLYDWGDTVLLGDFIPGSSLGMYPLIGTVLASDLESEGGVPADPTWFDAVMKHGATRPDSLAVVVTSSRQRTLQVPAGAMSEKGTGCYHWADYQDLVCAHSNDREITIDLATDSELDTFVPVVLLETDSEVTMRMRARTTRPITSEFRTYDYAGTLKGILPADITRTLRLDGSDSISAVLPWQYVKDDGTIDRRASMVTAGWYMEYGGAWFRIQDFSQDIYENQLPVNGVSRETELAKFLTNYSTMPLSMPSHTPTEIMDAVLSGQPECQWYNGDFSQLDETGFPAGWTAETGTWTARPGPEVECTGPYDGDAVLASWGVNHTSGAELKLKYDFHVSDDFDGIIQARLSWTNVAGVESHSVVLNAPYEPGWNTYESTEWLPVQNVKCVLSLEILGNTEYGKVRFRNVRFTQNEDDTGWRYAGTMDVRAPEIAYSDPTLQLFGTWVQDPNTETVYSYTVGDVLARVFTGDQITVHFATAGIGSGADIRVDGVVAARGLDVSVARDYAITDLDRYRSHVIEVVVNAGAVSISGMTVSTENRISVSWSRATVYEALRDLQNMVGGEYYYDTAARYIYHDQTQGQDVTDASLLWLQEGVNLVSFVPNTTNEIDNRLYYGGAGDGAFQIVLRADSTETQDGYTSQDLYGVQRTAYTNKDVRDWHGAWTEALREVEKNAFQRQTYTAEVLDADAALLAAGDSVRVSHAVLGVTVTTIEVESEEEEEEPEEPEEPEPDGPDILSVGTQGYMRPDLDIFAIGLKGYVAGETSGGGGGGGGGTLVPVEVVQPATQTLRVLEITRRSDGKPARLILGERTTISDAARQSEDIRRKVNQLLRV